MLAQVSRASCFVSREDDDGFFADGLLARGTFRKGRLDVDDITTG